MSRKTLGEGRNSKASRRLTILVAKTETFQDCLKYIDKNNVYVVNFLAYAIVQVFKIKLMPLWSIYNNLKNGYCLLSFFSSQNILHISSFKGNAFYCLLRICNKFVEISQGWNLEKILFCEKNQIIKSYIERKVQVRLRCDHK